MFEDTLMIRKLKKQKKKKIPIQHLLILVFIGVIVFAIMQFRAGNPLG